MFCICPDEIYILIMLTSYISPRLSDFLISLRVRWTQRRKGCPSC